MLSKIFHILRLIIPEFIIFLQFLCNCHVNRASSGPENDPKPAELIQKRFLIIRHFGRFWSKKSALSDGQAGANGETFWPEKIRVHLTPCHASENFRLK